MVKKESGCVRCTGVGLPCLGAGCPLREVSVNYCDECMEKPAVYSVDGSELCERCAEEYLQEAFEGLDFSERAEMMGIEFRRLANA